MPAMLPRPILHAKQLLVEGRSPELFCEALVQWLNLADVQLQNFGGITDLPGFLRVLRNEPGFAMQVASLGIIRDAEANSTGAFQSVCSALRGASLPEPPQPLAVAPGPPAVSVFILPDCSGADMLEDLCLQALSGDLAMPCVDEFFACLQRQAVPLPTVMPKALLQAFLASRPRSDMQLGRAAQAGYFPWACPVFDMLKQFLQAL
jgi:hypothetical protein